MTVAKVDGWLEATFGCVPRVRAHGRVQDSKIVVLTKNCEEMLREWGQGAHNGRGHGATVEGDFPKILPVSHTPSFSPTV